MRWDRFLVGEGVGWSLGFVGFGMVMYAIYLTTSSEEAVDAVAMATGWVVGGFVVAVLGLAIATTSREHRGAGHATGDVAVSGETDGEPDEE